MRTLCGTAASACTVALCRLAISITALHWLASGDELGFSVAVGALLLSIVPTRLLRDSLLRDTTAAVIAMLLAAHIVLGMQVELYETSRLYDKAVHTLGSGAIAGILIAASQTYCTRCGIKLPLMLVVTVVFAGTLSAGTLWEFFEFAMDRTGLFHAQRGLDDTMFDLLADATGAILATSVLTATIRIRVIRARPVLAPNAERPRRKP